jgi:hemoglobin
LLHGDLLTSSAGLPEATAREVCPEAEAHFVERARWIATSLELGIAGA